MPCAYSKHQDLWGEFCACMVRGFSIRKTADILGNHPGTAFRWRHRVLDALRALEKPTLSGVIEADETFFRYSEKGQTIRGRKPRRRGAPARKRGLSREQVCVVVARDRENQTVTEVVGRGSPSTRMITDALGPVVDSYHSRLRKWMRRFNEVATKYLRDYMRWYLFLDGAMGLDLVTSRRRMLTDACSAWDAIPCAA